MNRLRKAVEQNNGQTLLGAALMHAQIAKSLGLFQREANRLLLLG